MTETWTDVPWWQERKVVRWTTKKNGVEVSDLSKRFPPQDGGWTRMPVYD